MKTEQPGNRHKYDDDGVCVYCGLDGVEASFYSQRGYAHEYPDYFADCRKAPPVEVAEDPKPAPPDTGEKNEGT